MRTAPINASLERTLTRDRLTKYLEAEGDDLNKALALYEYNTMLSEAFYAPLQCIEVCLRNALNGRMTETYGQDWFNNGNAPLNAEARGMIEDAYDKLRHVPPPVAPGRVVAELKFAFWVSLLGPPYDGSLWRQTLYKGFLAGGGKSRSVVHGRFNALRRFRNRVAHHEPIFHRPVERLHGEIVEAVGWMCRDTERWAMHNSRFPKVFNSN